MRRTIIINTLVFLGAGVCVLIFLFLLIKGLVWIGQNPPTPPPCQNVETIKSLYRVANGNYLNTRTYIYEMTNGNYWEDVDGDLRQPGDVICADDMR